MIKRIVKPRGAKWSTTKLVDSRVTSYEVHSWNLSLHEELVGTKFTRELMGLVGVLAGQSGRFKGSGCRGRQQTEWERVFIGFNKSTINLSPNT